MGEKITGNNDGRSSKSTEQLLAEAKRLAGNGGQRTTKRNHPTDTAKPDTSAGGTGDTGGTSKIRVNGESEEEKLLGATTLEAPKPRKPRTRKTTAKELAKEERKEQTSKMLAGLLGTGSMIVAQRAGGHWAFTEQECLSISKPMVEIIDQYDLLDKMGEYGHFIALAGALAMVVVPRTMYSLQIRKDRKVKAPNVQFSSQAKQPAGTTSKPDTGKSDTGSQQSDGTNADGNSSYAPSNVKKHLSGIVIAE